MIKVVKHKLFMNRARSVSAQVAKFCREGNVVEAVAAAWNLYHDFQSNVGQFSNSPNHAAVVKAIDQVATMLRDAPCELTATMMVENIVNGWETL